MKIDTLASLLDSLSRLREQTSSYVNGNDELLERVDSAIEKTIIIYETDGFYDEDLPDDQAVPT